MARFASAPITTGPARLFPMLQRSMGRAKTAIIHRLGPKISIVHPWIISFHLPMPREVFDLLNKETLGLTRFGIDTPGSVTITFSNLRRLTYLFDQFQDCGGFRKQLGKGKREAKLIVNSEKKETMVYNAKEQILRAKFFMDIGIRMGLVRISQQ